MKRILFFLIPLLILTALSFAQETTSVSKNEKEEAAYNQIKEKGFTLQWKVQDKRLHVVLETEARGWVAFGIDPDRVMKGANFIMGYVDDKGKVHIADHWGDGIISHKADTGFKGGKNDVKDISGSQKDKITRIAFSIPMDSGDKYDKVLKQGKTYTVLLAASVADNFTTHHNRKAKVKIKL